MRTILKCSAALAGAMLLGVCGTMPAYAEDMTPVTATATVSNTDVTEIWYHPKDTDKWRQLNVGESGVDIPIQESDKGYDWVTSAIDRDGVRHSSFGRLYHGDGDTWNYSLGSGQYGTKQAQSSMTSPMPINGDEIVLVHKGETIQQVRQHMADASKGTSQQPQSASAGSANAGDAGSTNAGSTDAGDANATQTQEPMTSGTASGATVPDSGQEIPSGTQDVTPGTDADASDSDMIPQTGDASAMLGEAVAIASGVMAVTRARKRK